MYFLDGIFVDVCILRLHWIFFWGTKKGVCMFAQRDFSRLDGKLTYTLIFSSIFSQQDISITQ